MAQTCFTIESKLNGALARAGSISTQHGQIKTPAFIPVATKATLKALIPRDIASLGVQALLANTYHLYLQPGSEVVQAAGGLARFMGWQGPSFTDSGGFQVFSLGAAFDKRTSKFGSKTPEGLKMTASDEQERSAKPAEIDANGVTFYSHLDGSKHYFTPEHSIQIQHAIGADIIFAFDECASPEAPFNYQKEAMDRTHAWARRSLAEHERLGGEQLLFGIVQGGKHTELRQQSALTLSSMEFDGFGIGGSFDKADIASAVKIVNSTLPEDKPRHLLGIGEPEDLFLGIENGCDTFDCVAPTRMGRTGTLYTRNGKINITNASYAREFAPIDDECDCYCCKNFTKAYVRHLFQAKEITAAVLATIHNVRFIVRLVDDIRAAIVDGTFKQAKDAFLSRYKQ